LLSSVARFLREIELADQVGLDVFGVGEHHRPDYVVSSPAVVLAAAAERTKRIRLTSAVTVLSSDDPVRVFQDFAILDLLSGGRAEIMAGRGSFIESFPLKILFQHEIFGHRRFLAQLSVGTMPHEKVMRAIELLGTKVAPAVRAEVARRTAVA
jgi:alkanesulfonate monooxygenase SsuD/methylene tetrahydromethanopterin reductase-like flavin-dependent oxidoreductase (luciferase family)